MKDKFIAPEIEIIAFEVEDIVTASLLIPGMEDGGEGSGGETGY